MKQSEVISSLLQAKSQSQLSHAYLFYGTQHNQLTALMFELAAKLQCEHDGCMQCVRCQKILSNQYVDLVYIDLDSDRLKKDQISELKLQFTQKPLEGNMKIYIISNIFNATNQALNSLLKFLEEPTGNVIALLSCDNIQRGMETIISRCTLIRVDKYSVAELMLELEDVNHPFKFFLLSVTNDTMTTRWLLDQPEFDHFMENVIALINNKYENTSSVFQAIYFQKLSDKKWIELLCDMLLYIIRNHNNEVCDILNLKNVVYKLEDVESITRLRSELALNINKAMIIDQIISL